MSRLEGHDGRHGEGVEGSSARAMKADAVDDAPATRRGLSAGIAVATGTPRPLQGVRILDLTRNLPGPFATGLLAELGAVVVKVEPPEGDPARQIGALHAALNGGKDVRTADFKSAEGIAQILGWAAEADVVVEGFRPGVMAAMGLGLQALAARQPRIVLCSITGYGQTGPWAQRAGHDINYMAVSGVLDQCRSLGGEPAMANVQWGDLAGGGSMACIGILAALQAAQRTGQPQHVDISMTHGLQSHLVMARSTGPLLQPLLGRLPGAGEDMLSGALPCYRLYRTADDRWLAVGALEHKFWKAASEAFGHPEWADRHWQRGMLPHTDASKALIEEVAALVRSRPLAEWVARFEGVDACVTPVVGEVGERAQ
jgi:crotonobetainyl-CoA:carnitine CoA-transferase CaiB-like acyl-CoA transferase